MSTSQAHYNPARHSDIYLSRSVDFQTNILDRFQFVYSLFCYQFITFEAIFYQY